MATKILFAPKQSDAVIEIAREPDARRASSWWSPSPARPSSTRRPGTAEYYLGLARQMGGEFFRSAPEAASWSSSSAPGYDRVDIEAARKAEGARRPTTAAPTPSRWPSTRSC